MIKVVGLVKRRKDLTREQFKDYWLNEHGKLSKKNVEVNPVRKTVASFATGEPLFGKEPEFDGMVEMYFDSVEDMRAQFKNREWAEIIREDEKNFLDPSGEKIFFVAEEYVMAVKTPVPSP